MKTGRRCSSRHPGHIDVDVSSMNGWKMRIKSILSPQKDAYSLPDALEEVVLVHLSNKEGFQRKGEKAVDGMSLPNIGLEHK